MKAKVRTANGVRFHTTRIEVPAFKSEAEEAAWWDSHPKAVDDLIRRAERAGAVTRGEVARTVTAMSPTKITTIRLPVAMIETVRGLAAKKGLRYQTYLRMIIADHIHNAG